MVVYKKTLNNRMYYYIPYEDIEARNEMKMKGGRWHPDLKMWSLPIEKPDLSMAGNDIPECDISGYKFVEPMPYEHQKEMMRRCIAMKKYGLFAEMGLGKTRVMIDVIQFLKDSKLVSRSIVICPKSLIYPWIEQTKIWGKDLKAVAITGTTREKERCIGDKSYDLYITNYETILRYELQGFNLVCLDESQKIKDHQAKRTKRLIGKDAILQEAEYRFILTGTPITQSPLDFYAQIRFLDRDYLGFNSFYAFRNRYAVMGGYMNYQVIGYNHIEELTERVRRFSITLKKEDCLDLPDKIYESRIIEMTEEMKAQYKKMKDDLCLEIEGKTLTAQIALVKLLRLQQISSGCFLKGDNPKMEELIDIVKDYKDSVVIWARFRESISKISASLEKLGYIVGQIHGDVSAEDRQKSIEGFRDGLVNVIVGQISAGGLGITLTRASLVIYYENTFSLQDRLQSEDRTHRIGMTKPCTYIDLCYEKTIDSYILSCINKKQDMADRILSDIKTIVGGD